MAIRLYLLIAALLFTAGFAGGWKADSVWHDAQRMAEARGEQRALDASAKAIAKLDVKQVTIRQEVQTRVIEKPVYRDCRHDPAAYRLLNSALTDAPISAGSGVVPAADATIRRLFWGHYDEAGRSGAAVQQVPQSGSAN